MAHGMGQYAETIDKEQIILDFLYDEGPTTTEGLSKELGFHIDWLRKSLTNLRVEGRIKNEILRSDGTKYWLLAN